VIVGSEGRGRWLGGFDRNLRAVALSRLVGQRLRMLSSKPRQEVLQRMRELFEAGKVTPVIDRTYPLGEVPRPSGIWYVATEAAARSSSPCEAPLSPHAASMS
jgi:NADPH:quinone reductase-like Zn-dependent oxidoreductase